MSSLELGTRRSSAECGFDGSPTLPVNLDPLRSTGCAIVRSPGASGGGRRRRGRCGLRPLYRLVENGHGALKRLLNVARLSCRRAATAVMAVVMMMHPTATGLAGCLQGLRGLT